LEGTKEAAAGINVVAIALASITLAIGIFFPVVTGYLLALFAGLIP
jgi:hypothetical protein